MQYTPLHYTIALGVAGKGIRNIGRRSGEDDVGERERQLEAIVKYSEKLERSLHTQVDLGKECENMADCSGRWRLASRVVVEDGKRERG